ncbi:MAG: hypothetical protein FJ137_00940, partial [Deltaproteobacteria bacterium]|nr:hypothetical protein [Deltaproteobacteria bacterium]
EHDLALAVARGELGATVVDSDVLAHVRAYNPDVAPWAILKKDRALALAVHPRNVALKAALDAFLIERALTTGRDAARRLDLDGLVRRGSIRVLTKNDDVSYFLRKGEQRGFDHDLIALFAAAHHLRIEVVVPPDPAALCASLTEGRGDVLAALLPDPGCGDPASTTTSPPVLVPELYLLQPASSPTAPATPDATTTPKTTSKTKTTARAKAAAAPAARVVDLAGLRGRTIHVPMTLAPSVVAALAALSTAHGFALVADAPDDVGARADAVAGGALPLSVLGALERGMLDGRRDVRADVVLGRDAPRVWVTRAAAPQLSRALASFVREHVTVKDDGTSSGSTVYNLLRRAYLTPAHAQSTTKTTEPDRDKDGGISRWDPLIRRRAAEAGLDWRLLAAQAFQESRFDPDAKSAVGAQGLFQVMPATGRELGFTNLRDPEQGVAAGAKYMAWLLEHFDPAIPFKHRVRFALAAYNAGKGHVDDARLLARQMGLDPNRWFQHVERAMLRLADPRVARAARHGYCRGSEPVAYVSQITTRYENYTTLVDLTPAAVMTTAPPPTPPTKTTTPTTGR